MSKTNEKLPVDLQSVEAELPEIEQARETGAKVIEGDFHAEFLQALDLRVGARLVADQHRFGDFEF